AAADRSAAALRSVWFRSSLSTLSTLQWCVGASGKSNHSSSTTIGNPAIFRGLSLVFRLRQDLLARLALPANARIHREAGSAPSRSHLEPISNSCSPGRLEMIT